MKCDGLNDAREQRGKAIASQGNQIKKVNDHSFKVKSQSGSKVYEVKATPNGMTCTCPDFVYRGGKCKHIQATRYYLEIEKDTPQGVVTEKVHLTYKQAWDDSAIHPISKKRWRPTGGPGSCPRSSRMLSGGPRGPRRKHDIEADDNRVPGAGRSTGGADDYP